MSVVVLLYCKDLLIKNEQGSFNSIGSKYCSRVVKMSVKVAENSNCKVTSKSRVSEHSLVSNGNGNPKSMESFSSDCVEISSVEFTNLKVNTKSGTYYHLNLIKASYFASYKSF